MPHVSSKKLKKEFLQKLYRELGEAMENSAKRSWFKFFLQDFLTKTEKIMLAKRFAVICMLEQGIPPSYIAEALGMSPATIHRMSLRHEVGRYQAILRTIKKNDKDLWQILEKILLGGLPPRAGRGRWKFLYEKPKF